MNLTIKIEFKFFTEVCRYFFHWGLIRIGKNKMFIGAGLPLYKYFFIMVCRYWKPDIHCVRVLIVSIFFQWCRVTIVSIFFSMKQGNHCINIFSMKQGSHCINIFSMRQGDHCINIFFNVAGWAQDGSVSINVVYL